MLAFAACGTQPQAQKDALNFERELVDYAELTGSTGGEPRSCRGGKLVAVVEKQAKLDTLYFALPDGLRASSPQDATAVVWVRRIARLYGRYNDGATTVDIEDAWLVVLDRATGARVHESAKFEGAKEHGSRRDGHTETETWLPSVPAMIEDLRKACG